MGVKELCHVRSCHICPKIEKNSLVHLIPVQSSQLASRPFEEIANDIVGELRVPSGRSHLYILTMVDLCTRWVVAIPLKYLTAEDIADALLFIFCRMGCPDVILSDNRTVCFPNHAIFNRHALNRLFVQFPLSPTIEWSD